MSAYLPARVETSLTWIEVTGPVSARSCVFEVAVSVVILLLRYLEYLAISDRAASLSGCRQYRH